MNPSTRSGLSGEYDLQTPSSRRRFILNTSAFATAASLYPTTWGWASTKRQRPRVAAVMTVFTHRSHGHVIMENFLGKYHFNGNLTDPGVDVASLYVDQFPDGDMSRKVAKQFGIPIFPTIGEAMRVGGRQLAVDAVLSIGEHGSYPINERGQTEYPRKRFFDEIVTAMRQSNRYIPVFNDKHLSFRWDWAKEMYDTSAAWGIPLMAGSSVPLAERRPQLQLPPHSEITEAISIHGGPVESYDFHGLEVLQSMVEGRHGGESGVASVEFVSGKELWKAAEQGRWSLSLAKTAMAAELGQEPSSLEQLPGEPKVAPHAILLRYRDGFKATVLKVGRSSTRWNFACRLKGESQPQATSFYVGPWQNRCLFKALSHAIQHHFKTGRAPYPVERTLMVTGILDAAMQARQQKQSVSTPHLSIGYAARDFSAMRELGSSWNLITENMPEPQGLGEGI